MEGILYVGDKPYVLDQPVTETLVQGLSQINKGFALELTRSKLHEAEAKVLVQNSLLTRLRISSTLVTLETMTVLCSSPYIKHLELAQLPLWAMCTETFRPLVQNTTITKLKLEDGGLDINLTKALTASSSLTDLHVRDTYAKKEVAETLFRSTTLQKLKLHETRATCATEPLEHNTTLTKLRLNHGHLYWKDMAPFTRNTMLKWLTLNNNEVGDDGAALLAANTTIETLCLYNNEVHDKGVQALALNTSILYLNIAGNFIGECGFVALSQNTTLWSLDVSYNHSVRNRIAPAALANNTSIISIRVRDYPNSLLMSFSTNTTLLYLHNDLWCYEIESRMRMNRERLTRFPMLFTLLAHMFASLRYNKRR